MLAISSEAVIVDRLLFGADELVGEWVEKRCGGDAPPAGARSIALLNRKGEIVAGALFYALHDGCDLTVTAAVERPSLRLRSAMRAALSYAFDQLQVQRLSAEITVTNSKMVRLATGIGFQLEGVKRRAAVGGGNVGVFGLLRGELRI